jgi:hypothetical protein
MITVYKDHVKSIRAEEPRGDMRPSSDRNYHIAVACDLMKEKGSYRRQQLSSWSRGGDSHPERGKRSTDRHI